MLIDQGKATADSKIYLYVDPARYLAQAATMWNPLMNMGTVEHQQVGYLFPMGPFFLVAAELHLPIWISQRLWMGSLLFVAGTGVLYLCKQFEFRPGSTLVAALAFELSPYLLQYIDQQSVLLISWSVVGWLLALGIRSVRFGGWRCPAIFALLAAMAGASNGTAFAAVMLAVVLWFPYALWVTHEVRFRQLLAAVLRLGSAMLLLSVWWIVSLLIESKYGLDILKYTETVPQTAVSSLSSEVLRGLGYWYFYGREVVGPWHLSSLQYEHSVWLILVSFALPALAFLSAALVRWAHRAYFIILIVVGTVLAVSVHPYSHPSVAGRGLESFLATTAGSVLRNSNRVAPIVVLGTAMLLGAGIEALSEFKIEYANIGIILISLLALLDNPSIWTGQALTPTFLWTGKVPTYVHEVSNALQSSGSTSRALLEPGSPYGDYPFGYTNQPIYSALTTRPIVDRQRVPEGTEPTVNLLTALDEPVQEETLNPATLAPLARLMSVGSIVWQSNLEYERYNIPPPQLSWSWLVPTPVGLSSPKQFGPKIAVKNTGPLKTLNEQLLSLPANTPAPPSVAIFTVKNPRPIVRAESPVAPMVVDGGGRGLAEAAAAGLLNANPTILYAGSLTYSPKLVAKNITPGSQLVLTDTNRKQAERWDTLSNNFGYIETSSEIPPPDPSDSRLNLFPYALPSAWTTDDLQGVASVSASAYGDPSDYQTQDRPLMAIDGNLGTAWELDGTTNPQNQWWSTTLLNPVSTNHVVLVQPLIPNANRWITKVTLTFDGGSPVTVNLTAASRKPSGQVITFSRRTFTTLRVTIDSTNWANSTNSFLNAAPVGFSQVEVGGAQATELIATPTDLLTALGSASNADRLTILLQRIRESPYPPASDPETTLSRIVNIPQSRKFSVSGEVRLNKLLSDHQIDVALGQVNSKGPGIVASSSGYLSGDPASRASAAIDGNPATAWSSPFGNGDQLGSYVKYKLPSPITFSTMNLRIVADGWHSVPTELKVSTQSGNAIVKLPPIKDQPQHDATVSVPVHFAPLSGSTIKVTILGVRSEYTQSKPRTELPVAIAELGIPGLYMPPAPTKLPSTCMNNLLTLNGVPVSVRLNGTTADALAHDPIPFKGCGPDANGVTLDSGNNVIQGTRGNKTGFNVDDLWLDSAPGGAPMPFSSDGKLIAPTSSSEPPVHVISSSSTSMQLTMKSPGKPFWLVLGQSLDSGWSASIDGGTSLGAPTLIDGYANGWMVTNPPPAGQVINFNLVWTPQKIENAAIVLSLAGAIVAIFLIIWPRRRSARGKHESSSKNQVAFERRNVPYLRFREVEERQSSSSATNYLLQRTPAWSPPLTKDCSSSAPTPSKRLFLGIVVALAAALLLPPFTPNGGAGYIFSTLAALSLGAIAWAVLGSRLRGISRWIVSYGPAIFVVIIGLYVAGEAIAYGNATGGTLPNWLDTENVFGWIALLLIAISVVIELFETHTSHNKD